MQIPNLTLAYLIAELKPIVEGGIVRNVQELSNGWLKLKLQSKQGSKDLIITPGTFFLTGCSFPAKQMTSGYGAFLRKHLRNKRIVSLQQHGFDRVALLEFPESTLVLELFAKGNILLIDKKQQILSAFRKEQWKDRTLRKEQQYIFPASKGANPLQLKASELRKLFAKSETDAVRALMACVNIAPVFAEAACAISGVVGKNARDLNEKEIEKICKNVKEIYSVDLSKAKPVLVEKSGEEMLLPFQLQLPSIKIVQEFNSTNAAIDSTYSRQFSAAGETPEQKQFEKKRQQLLHSIEEQKKAVEELQQAVELNQAKANAIYLNYQQIAGLLAAAKPLKEEKNTPADVMYNWQKRFPFLQKIDFKKGIAIISLPEK
ncbi:MAG: NFACT family protein [Candidatus Diapherotrites archaeon]|nr:NFACT family protein [Candidatus Diapherotrites archaeon]